MAKEEMFINRIQLSVLKNILSNVSDSLNDCHYLTNIKGIDYKHRLSGFQHFISRTQIEIVYSKGFISEELIQQLIKCLEEFLAVFTVGGHRLEVKLFNELFLQKRLLIELYKVIFSDCNN